jgi:hypothetical protein
VLFKLKKFHNAWKDLEKTQKMNSISAFYRKPFRNGGQLKSRKKNLKLQVMKNAMVFTFHFQAYHFQTAVTSKPMIKKRSGWSHSLHLVEFFQDLTNFLKIDSAEKA